MKIRNGFVSNSSSSSFVVAFDEKPETVEELKKLLFGDEKVYGNPYRFNSKDPRGWTAEEVSETVFRDLKDEKPLTKKQVIKEFSSGWLGGAPEYPWDAKYGSEEWEEAMKKRDEYCENMAETFMMRNKGKLFFRFSYSDNDGAYYSALEHGHLFEKLPHICISHH